MRVFNASKTEEIKEYDLTKGYKYPDKLITHHEQEVIHREAVEGVDEVGHYETIREYPNGGRDLRWVVDVERVKPRDEYDEVVQEAYDEEEDIEVYVPYTEEQLKEMEIDKLKIYLASTDYCVIKCMDIGESMNNLYPEIQKKRAEARLRINELEE